MAIMKVKKKKWFSGRNSVT